MKYLIWYNATDGQFEFGSEEDFLLLKEKHGRKVLLKKAFNHNVSPNLIKKAIFLLNRDPLDTDSL